MTSESVSSTAIEAVPDAVAVPSAGGRTSVKNSKMDSNWRNDAHLNVLTENFHQNPHSHQQQHQQSKSVSFLIEPIVAASVVSVTAPVTAPAAANDNDNNNNNDCFLEATLPTIDDSSQPTEETKSTESRFSSFFRRIIGSTETVKSSPSPVGRSVQGNDVATDIDKASISRELSDIGVDSDPCQRDRLKGDKTATTNTTKATTTLNSSLESLHFNSTNKFRLDSFSDTDLFVSLSLDVSFTTINWLSPFNFFLSFFWNCFRF